MDGFTRKLGSTYAESAVVSDALGEIDLTGALNIKLSLAPRGGRTLEATHDFTGALVGDGSDGRIEIYFPLASQADLEHGRYAGELSWDIAGTHYVTANFDVTLEKQLDEA